MLCKEIKLIKEGKKKFHDMKYRWPVSYTHLEYIGKGVSYCAVCDGAFYKDKSVVVAGGGNSALGDALYLSDICHDVYIVHRRDEFRGDAATLKKLKERKNVHIITSVNIQALRGEKKLEEVLLSCLLYTSRCV